MIFFTFPLHIPFFLCIFALTFSTTAVVWNDFIEKGVIEIIFLD